MAQNIIPKKLNNYVQNKDKQINQLKANPLNK